MLSEDILYLSVRELGERIRSGTLSPVELTESFLTRSEALGPKLNAYATITRELALQQADAAEKEIAARTESLNATTRRAPRSMPVAGSTAPVKPTNQWNAIAMNLSFMN